MSLSDLIHKSKKGKVATLTVATNATQGTALKSTAVAKVASVTVANPAESKGAELCIVCYTPAGNPIWVQARNAEHAVLLQKMNPTPIET